MELTQATTKPAGARRRHPEHIKHAARQLHRMDWGGIHKIAKLLGRRYHTSVSPYTVYEWISGVPQDLDPLALALPATVDVELPALPEAGS